MLLEWNGMFYVLTGTLGFNQSTFLMEMSQIGFSTHILNVSILFKLTFFMDLKSIALSIVPAYL